MRTVKKITFENGNYYIEFHLNSNFRALHNAIFSVFDDLGRVIYFQVVYAAIDELDFDNDIVRVKAKQTGYSKMLNRDDLMMGYIIGNGVHHVTDPEKIEDKELKKEILHKHKQKSL